MKWIVQAGALTNSMLLGGKGAGLVSLQRAGLPVPEWFAITPEACRASLGTSVLKLLENAGDSEQPGTVSFQPSAGLMMEVNEALEHLAPGNQSVAVRSSAIDEDGATHSFAGQLESYLNVPKSEVNSGIARVWESAFGPRARAYRRLHGLAPAPAPPAVLIQQMILADAAGVAFTADPLTGRRGVTVVCAGRGAGEALVSGRSVGDTYRLTRAGEIEQRDVAADQPVLRDELIREIAGLARRAANWIGSPQDIEWALQDGRIYLLQARPITTLRSVADPDGERRLWDNSNIIESYGGMTTPLTYSFARHAYEGVYREFCRLMRVPSAAIADHSSTFAAMIGYIQGRVYYNLTNWHRVLALLPGYKWNRQFMEQMMGVSRKGLPHSGEEEEGQSGRGLERIWDLVLLGRTVAALVWNYWTLPSQIRAFRMRLDRALIPSDPPLEEMRPDELAAYFRALERQLLTRWDAPLVNDFFAMIFHGVLRRLCERWCDDRTGALASALMRRQGGMISAEPAKRLPHLADLAQPHPALTRALESGSADEVRRQTDRAPEFAQGLRAYLEEFGERCLEELKLESPTLHDDPTPLYRAIGALMRRPPAPTPRDHAIAAPESALEQTGLADRPTRAALFRWILNSARARVVDRENLRFERTRLFGRVRRIFVELGRRLHALGNLNDARDVFFLELEEVLGYCDGTGTVTDLNRIAALRRDEFDRWRTSVAPPDRFESRGIVNQTGSFEATRPADNPSPMQESDVRFGQGCCPGKVRGTARLVTDPRHAGLRPGEILVAERTDPGWVLLFPAAAGLLVQRGSLLSHSAIVARELGLPAVIAVPDLMNWLQTGDQVELDGSTGQVRLLARSCSTP